MQKHQISLIIAFLSLFASRAHSAQGAVNGGGGKGVYCQAANGTMTSLTLLDLYEAAEGQGWNPLPQAPTLARQLALVQDRIKAIWPTVGAVVSNPITELPNDFHYLPQGERLPVTHDATTTLGNPSCRLVQIAVWKDDALYSVDIDREYWNKLSPLNQAALIVHEWFYFLQRQHGGDKNSQRARAVTAFIMSQAQITAVGDGMPVSSADYYAIGSLDPANIYFVYNNLVDGIAGITVQLDYVDGLPVLSKTAVFVPGQDARFFDDKLATSSVPWNGTFTVAITSLFLPGIDALRFTQINKNGLRGILTELHTASGYKSVHSIGHTSYGPPN